MKVSKKTRGEAWTICAVAASTPGLANAYRSTSRLLGSSYDSFRLALFAWERCVLSMRSAGVFDPYEHADAEAAQLLSDGWSPGDEP